ncbi:hypothetical protein [Halorussus caseinilyticus]|uniref:Uncharacterized protein n=1 Tax=Halorussus caseinilyticus TaxID=3034025 RepID=A0ABD5WHC3_9EURY|nr:hypothetical protein [Halorussus sp. DT72]
MQDSEEVKLDGKFAIAFIEAVADVSPAFEDRARTFLEENGISEPSADEAYPADAFVNAFEQITDEIGSTTTRKIGIRVIETVDWPPGIDSVESGFDVLNETHAEVYGDAPESIIGRYRFEKTGDREARGAVTENFPYPRACIEGLFEGMLEEFTSDSVFPNVSETDARDDEKYAFELSW